MRAGRVVVEAGLDDLRSDDVRFLQEAAKGGPLHVRVPSDALIERQTGARPRFPQAERLFLAGSLRWIDSVELVDQSLAELAATVASSPCTSDAFAGASTLALRDEDHDPALQALAQAEAVDYRRIGSHERVGFPVIEADDLPADAKTVIVTGCFDWVHSGHVRFFMDAAAYGPLYVVIGSDRNVRLLKGEGHPLQVQEERRYMVGSMRPVYRCLVSSGSGWMDAEPEIERLRPTFYVVNEDGDKPEKRAFCETHGLRYTVLQRVPHAGLPARSSTDLRGF